MSPKELDWVVNGVPVNINRRPDGSLYATITDFSRFGIKPEAVVRVPAFPEITVAYAEGHVSVLAKMEELRCDVKSAEPRRTSGLT